MKKTAIIKGVGGRLRCFPAFVFLIFAVLSLRASDPYKIPDFAFPKKVECQSDSLLSLSLKNGDGIMALRSVMNLCVANALTSVSENIGYDVGLIDSTANMLKGEYRSLALLLEATVLQTQYGMQRDIYDQRNLPFEGVYPSDPTEWSGEMYKTKILSLIDEATENITSFPATKIEEVAILLSDIQPAQKIGMNLPEFILLKGERILKQYIGDDRMSVIPFYPREEETSIEGECRLKAKALADMLIRQLWGENEVMKGFATVEFASLLPDKEREKYLKEALARLKDTEAQGILLYELYSGYHRNDSELYAEIESWLKKFPKGYASSQLQYAAAQMSQKRIEVEVPSQSLPGQIIMGKATLYNVEKGYLLVYKLSKNQYNRYDRLILKRFTPSAKPAQVIEISQEGRIPFSNEKEFEIPALSEGLYVIVPSTTTKLPKKWKSSDNSNLSTFRVSQIAILSSVDSNEKDSGKVYVVNGENQQPVKGAVVQYFEGDKKKSKGKLITNEEGWAEIPNGYYRLEATYGKSVARSEAGFSYYPANNPTSRHASILTDLAIYRPGDTVRFAVVGWKQDNMTNSLMKGNKIEVSLRDANFSNVGCDTLALDDQGRANGSLVIPKGRLLGNYTLMANYSDFPGVAVGSAQIQVEEYKLPGFSVNLSQETTERDEIYFKGVAATYSGMPVTDGVVNIKVDFLPWRWGFYGNNASYQTSMETDSSGEFKLTLPLEGLKGTVFEKGRYSVTAEVTAPSGETQKSAPLYFYMGNAREIRPGVPDKIKIEGDNVKFYVPVYDMAGLPVQTNTGYTITCLNDTARVLTGKFISPNLYILADSLPSGRYELKFNTDDENSVASETVVWRASDKETPFPTSLWLPQTDYKYADYQDNIEITFGG